ncbi:MAG: YlxR family protein [Firmicutes bacterium]|nr:YlxR family protein [Bacillota bacterium]
MPKTKKIPQRICVGCQQTREKRELIRIVRTPDLHVVIDPTGKRSGRGAYICRDLKCLDAAIAGKQLQRALRVELPSEVLEELKKMLSGEVK